MTVYSLTDYAWIEVACIQYDANSPSYPGGSLGKSGCTLEDAVNVDRLYGKV